MKAGSLLGGRAAAVFMEVLAGGAKWVMFGQDVCFGVCGLFCLAAEIKVEEDLSIFSLRIISGGPPRMHE